MQKMAQYVTCPICKRLVLQMRMADHWITTYHHTNSIPAKSVV